MGRKGTMRILKTLSSGRKRFTDIYEDFRNPATLTRRLRELEEKGLVERIPLIDPGESAVIYYKLTDKGKSVLEIFNRLIRTLRE
ncbi:MAG: helix-turn-helix transcriptional regulator [Candidatus Bathyarchaeota archaeon]|nr:helix-turn-helix transcriptional regulator [Candidatus Bathyarchaeota archaeon]